MTELPDATKITNDRRHFRIFLFISTLLVAIVLYQPAQTLRIGSLLAENSILTDFPYHFRVISVRNGTATLSSLPEEEATLARCLLFLFPEIRNSSTPAMALEARRQELESMRQIAVKTILGHDQVDRVVMAFDKTWLHLYGPELAEISPLPGRAPDSGQPQPTPQLATQELPVPTGEIPESPDLLTSTEIESPVSLLQPDSLLRKGSFPEATLGDPSTARAGINQTDP